MARATRSKVRPARAPGAGGDRTDRPGKTARDGEAGGSTSGVMGLARQARSWAGSVLGAASVAADVSLGVAKSMLPKPEQRRAMEKAGLLVRELREAAGLSVKELGQAVDLDDTSLLELVESGKVALPFDIVLRLAAVLARNDPISFVMNLTRTYHPDLWKTLENLGIGKIVLQVGRERELGNIYRANDMAREMNDEEFAAVLAFTRSAFEAAMALINARKAAPPKAYTSQRAARRKRIQ